MNGAPVAPRGRAPLLAITVGALLGTLAACSSVPDPGGASLRTEHADVRSDGDGAFVASWATLLEDDHATLARLFGHELGRRYGIVLCASPAAFDRVAREHGKDPLGRDAYVHWGAKWEDEPCLVANVGTGSILAPARLLAHELVHVFAGPVWPLAPTWFHEGLAMELAHSNLRLENGREALECEEEIAAIASAHQPGLAEPELRQRFDAVRARQERVRLSDASGHDPSVSERCPARAVAGWPEADLARELAALEGFTSGWRSYLLAGAVVRFLIDTQVPSRLEDLGLELPSAGMLGRWLRERAKDEQGSLHESFPPVGEPSPRISGPG